MNLNFLLKFAATLITLSFLLIGIILILQGVGQSVLQVNQNDQADLVLNPSLEFDSELEINGNIRENSWGLSIQKDFMNSDVRSYISISQNDMTEVGYLDSNNNFNSLYKINENIKKLDIFSSAEIAYLTTESNISAQKFVLQSPSQIYTYDIPNGYLVQGFIFNYNESLFYLYGYRSNENFVVLNLNNQGKFNEIINTSSFTNQAEVLDINTNNQIIIRQGQDCFSFNLTNNDFVKRSCINNYEYENNAIYKENSNFFLTDLKSNSRTSLFPENKAVEYENFWFNNQKLYWLEKAFNNPSDLKLYSGDVGTNGISNINILFEISDNYENVDLVFLGNKVLVIVGSEILIEKITDTNILNSSDFSKKYRSTNWTDWFQVILKQTGLFENLNDYSIKVFYN